MDEMITSALIFLQENIWLLFWCLLVSLVFVIQPLYAYTRPLGRGNKLGEIKKRLEVDEKSKFQQKIKNIWLVRGYYAIVWIFSFLLGWTKSEDRTIQDKLDSRSKALKNVLADNYEISLHTNATKDVRDLSVETLHTAYRYSVVDLFVEKAIVILENQARPYKFFGVAATVTASLIILFGMVLASIQSGIAYDACKAVNIEFCGKVSQSGSEYKSKNEAEQELILESYQNIAKEGIATMQKEKNLSNKNEAIIKALIDRETNLAWKDMTVSFIKSFTFYGLLVLSAVFLQRYGKALLDQSERLLDRRHALRQGRLYLHLKDGRFKNVEEMEKAFNWNDSRQNAFADINTEAQAPWGTVFKEMIHMIPEIAKAVNNGQNANSGKK